MDPANLGFGELIEDWMAWFDEAMPDSSPESLWLKFEEEVEEFLSAEGENDELAECVDSLITLWRYAEQRFGNERLFLQLEKKLAINRKRRFEKMPDGTYHHV